MKKKTFYAFIAIILSVAIVITCGVGSSWYTNGNIKTWFNSWGAGEKQIEQPSNDGKEQAFDDSKDQSPEDNKENKDDLVQIVAYSDGGCLHLKL